MNDIFIVVDDPTGSYEPCEILGGQQAAVAKGKGAMLLPYDVSLKDKNGVAGFQIRHFGKGEPLSLSPKLHCPVTIYAEPQKERVHWAARLLPRSCSENAAVAGQGTLALATDGTQIYSRRFGLTGSQGIMLSAFGAPDARGGWTVGGQVGARFSNEGYYGLGLYGSGADVLVAWLAVSLG